MEHKALELLYKIATIEGIDRKSGNLARHKAIEEWISDWIIEENIKESVIKSNFKAEEIDFIKHHMSCQLAKELTEDVVNFSTGKNTVSASLLAIRRLK